MKCLIIMLFLFNCFVGLAQSKVDTVFLKKERTETSYNIVYIVDDTSFVRYNWLKSSIITGNYLALYNKMYEELRSNAGPVNSSEIAGIPKNWSCLYKHHGQYFVYSPSDWYSHFSYELSDSVLTKYTGEGPYPELLINFEKISTLTYSLETKSLYPKRQNNITINIIDPELGIAIWKISTDDSNYYRLMVNSDKVKMFPMAVNNCSSGKCYKEFEFDKLDFEKMITTYGNKK